MSYITVGESKLLVGYDNPIYLELQEKIDEILVWTTLLDYEYSDSMDYFDSFGGAYGIKIAIREKGERKTLLWIFIVHEYGFEVKIDSRFNRLAPKFRKAYGTTTLTGTQKYPERLLRALDEIKRWL